MTQLIDGKWKLQHCIGKGTFSKIYSAVAVNTRPSDGSSNGGSSNEEVAVKLQKRSCNKSPTSIFLWEVKVLRSLVGLSCVPQLYYNGKHNEKYDVIVMEYFSGQDMSKLRDETRQRIGFIPVVVAAYFSKMALQCTRSLHDRGFVHRDIKPANFVRRSSDSTEFCLIDFGITKQYRVDGTLVPKREKVDFRGTHIYASPHVQDLQDQSPRDDVYSVLFLFISMAVGRLPWTSAARAKEKSVVCELKQKFIIHEPESLIDWIEQVSISDFQDCPGSAAHCLPSIRENVLRIMTHVNSLSYEDSPDYDFIVDSLELMTNNKEEVAEVGDVAYERYGFHWNVREETMRHQRSATELENLSCDLLVGMDHSRLSGAGMAQGETEANEEIVETEGYNVEVANDVSTLMESILTYDSSAQDSFPLFQLEDTPVRLSERLDQFALELQQWRRSTSNCDILELELQLTQKPDHRLPPCAAVIAESKKESQVVCSGGSNVVEREDDIVRNRKRKIDEFLQSNFSEIMLQGPTERPPPPQPLQSSQQLPFKFVVQWIALAEEILIIFEKDESIMASEVQSSEYCKLSKQLVAIAQENLYFLSCDLEHQNEAEGMVPSAVVEDKTEVSSSLLSHELLGEKESTAAWVKVRRSHQLVKRLQHFCT